jgi:hypothetical protein
MSTTRALWFEPSVLVMAILLAAGGARAQEGEPGLARAPGREHLVTSFGTAFQAGGGIAHFNQGDTPAAGGTGGYWELRSVIGTRRRLALELGYLGSTRRLSMASADGALVSHGAEALLRLNVPTETASGFLLEPFSFMGLGWMRSAPTHDGAAGRSHHVLTVPVGFGFAFGRDGSLVSAQMTYRPVLAGDAVLRLPEVEAELQGWSLGARAGFEF